MALNSVDRKCTVIPQYGKCTVIPQYGTCTVIPQYGTGTVIPQYGTCTVIPQYDTCPFAMETMWKNSGILVQMNAFSSSEYWQLRKESTYIFQMQPTMCYISQFIYFNKTLYMFQAVTPSIIRSSNCTYSLWYCQTLLLPAAIMVGMDLLFAAIMFGMELQFHPKLI
jgi:hypothetical protein